MGLLNITEMTSDEARSFLMEENSYTHLDFPPYVSFRKSLDVADKILTTKRNRPNILQNIIDPDISRIENVNYSIITNKDSRYSWRPITLIHPIFYVDLVNTITQEDNWEILVKRFSVFRQKNLIKCVSIPGQSQTKESDKAETIRSWWNNFEQEQIAKALKYDYCVYTDISNCYPSIYTHSIAWALEDKKTAKEKIEDKTFLGNILDKKIQSMQNGQTNGIPQGSVLMDFIAELVLGYTDYEVSKVIKNNKLENDVEIIRYRDDYRIFGNDKTLLEKVTSILSETLVEFNFTLNKFKTFESEEIIMDSVKEDKQYWIKTFYSLARDVKYSKKTKDRKKFHYITDIGFQKQLFIIKDFSVKYPNSGQLQRALADFYDAKIYDLNELPKNYIQLISVTVDIMVNNPTALKQSYAIIGKLLSLIDDSEEIKSITQNMRKKFERRTHSDYGEIWLQSFDLAIGQKNQCQYNSQLTKSICENNVQFWNTNWLKLEKDQQKWNQLTIIDDDKLKEHSLVMDPADVSLFKNY